MKKTEEEYYNAKGGCILMSIKLMIAIFIFTMLFSCEKNTVEYYTINIETIDPFIHVYYGQSDNSFIDSSNYTGINYMVKYETNSNFYMWVRSTDSISLKITQGRDTILMEEGFQEIIINKRI